MKSRVYVKDIAPGIAAAPQITRPEARKEVVHAYSSHDQVTRFFNCPPETSLQPGLNSMALRGHKVGPRQGKPFMGVEIEREPAPSWWGPIG